jgi:hypothetical protein
MPRNLLQLFAFLSREFDLLIGEQKYTQDIVAFMFADERSNDYGTLGTSQTNWSARRQ